MHILTPAEQVHTPYCSYNFVTQIRHYVRSTYLLHCTAWLDWSLCSMLQCVNAIFCEFLPHHCSALLQSSTLPAWEPPLWDGLRHPDITLLVAIDDGILRLMDSPVTFTYIIPEGPLTSRTLQCFLLHCLLRFSTFVLNLLLQLSWIFVALWCWIKFNKWVLLPTWPIIALMVTFKS